MKYTHGRARKLGITGVALALLATTPALTRAAGFDAPSSQDPSQQLDTLPPPAPYGPNVQRQDTPNDPKYDFAEPDDETPGVADSTNIFDERFDLFGFASNRTRSSARYSDPNNPAVGRGMVSGFNAAGAWKITRGDPSVSVAILDTGINWDSSGLRDKVALNQGELPQPQPSDSSAPLGGYDLNRNGVLDVDDYKNDPRVGTPSLTGEDLIAAFSNGTDGDHNGYVDDIAGWDFFNDDNDPADTSSYFAAENHGSGRTSEAAERGNDGDGSIGVCPKCQFVPLRIWDTFVSDQNNFFLAVTYATDNGVEVIEGADGGLYHSSFAEKASQYAYDHGVAQVYSGDDLNTGNHNYPANYSHTMLIQGTVADAQGLGENVPSNQQDPGFRDAFNRAAGIIGVGTNVPVRTWFRGANTTQFGGHSSISMEGPTGSTNTGKAAGAAALVISAARQNGIELSADETRELLEQTAEDVLPGDTVGTGTPDPAQEGFDTHFGYGRANLGEAVRAASSGKIPPEASIASPDWYEPLTGTTASIKGLAKARPAVGGGAFTWKLEYGLGLAPTSWTEVRTGSSPGPAVTDFGTIPLGQIRSELAARSSHPDRDDSGGPVLDPDPKEDPYQGQFTVRLVATSVDGTVRKGIDRKVLTAVDDPTLRSGYPKHLGAGGEAPLRYADLNGDNVQELVLPTEDGRVHAYEPGGSELKGWPVKTETHSSAEKHLGSPAFGTLSAPLEAPRGPTIADLTGDGRPEVVTAAGERLYAWDAGGKLLRGWPIRPDPARANCATSQQQKGIKHPKCGFVATPAVGRLEGPGKPLDVVVPGLDGRLRAYRPDGSGVPGFPVRLIDPNLPASEKMTAESINNPAIGDLDGDKRDDVVVATNESYGGSASTGDVDFTGLLSDAAPSTSRVYAVKSQGNDAPGGDPFLPGWPIKPEGLAQNVLPFVGPGHDPALVKLPGDGQQVVVSVTGSTAIGLYGVNGTLTRQIVQGQPVSGGAFNLFESSAVGDVDGDGPGGPDIVKYQLDLSGAANLVLVGQNAPYSHRIGVFDATSGAKLPGWPVVTEDYQFLSSSSVAKVAAGPTNQVVAGTGLGLLHAYDGATGRDVAGFPKATGGWLFAPAALSDDGRIAGVTREGFLFQWNASDLPSCQSEWPSFRHDQQGTGNYDRDGTPPDAPDRMSLRSLGNGRYRLGFRSPGDDGSCGTATRYVADVNGQALDLGSPVKGGTQFTKDFTLPGGSSASGAVRVTARAADGPAGEGFNLGPPGVVALGAGRGPGAGVGVVGGGGAGTGARGGRRRCLPRRLRASGRRIGPARIGGSLRKLRRRYRAVRRTRRATRFCVRGRGRFLVHARRNRIDLVATTAKGHRTRRTGPGRRLRRRGLPGTHRVGRGLLVGHRSGKGRLVYGLRGRRVRFLALVTRRQARHPRVLRRRLRGLKLR